MRIILILLMAVTTVLSGWSYKYDYSFKKTPVSEALIRISKDHPEINISFIYKEIDYYKTSAAVRSNDAYQALIQTIGLNPISIIKKDKNFYLEALQHGKYRYIGKVTGTDNKPVVAATAMLLEPKDSTVITYGFTDADGRLSIPCDVNGVIVKLTSIGFRPTFVKANSFNLGTIIMKEQHIKLKTLDVKSDNALIYSDKTVYSPTLRQKNASANATDLLLQMSIPQIVVNPVSKTVQSPSGGNVSVFIDYLQATPQDMASLQARDVKRVEYLAYPQDPRFKGKAYVINFVMQKYEWGGYTRLDLDQWFSVTRSQGSLYSKFVYKKMMFDFYADEIFFENRHGGADMTEQFRFADLFGKGRKEIERRTFAGKYLYRANLNDFRFRAVYNNENIRFANTLGFVINNTPHLDNEERIEYSDDLFAQESSSRFTRSKDCALNYYSEFYDEINKSLSLNVEASAGYARNILNSTYQSTEKLKIINNAKENTYDFQVEPMVNWSISDSHSLSFSGQGSYTHHNIEYSGNSPSNQTYRLYIAMIGAGYDFISEKFRGGATFSWAWENNNITGHKVRNTFPVFEFHGSYTPDRKNQLEATLNFGRTVPDAVNKSPNILRQDALMWYTGTPELKDNGRIMTRLNYYWLPNNNWQFGFNSQYYHSKDRVSAVYSPDGPDGTMLKKYSNSGNFGCGMLGISGTLRLFDGKFSLTARPQVWLRKSTGVYNIRNNDWVCQVNATYYFGNFNLFAYYCTPNKYIEEESGYLERKSSQYIFTLGWHHGPWHISATAYNFFHTGWKASRKTLRSQYYDYERTDFDTDMHQRFSVFVSYTFRYGKKVNGRDEVTGRGSSKSAILK